MRQADVEATLGTLGYEKLFMGLDDRELDTLWRDPDAARLLSALAADSTADMQARFLAAEVLARERSLVPDSERACLASVYVAALRNAELANIWGMPGELDAPAGQHLVAIGAKAVAGLVSLLDDRRQVPYGGSEEATVGNSYKYRVKDFAAFFIHRILGVAYVLRKTPQERDAEIDRLRISLGC
jgi:hypothetical protein